MGCAEFPKEKKKKGKKNLQDEYINNRSDKNKDAKFKKNNANNKKNEKYENYILSKKKEKFEKEKILKEKKEILEKEKEYEKEILEKEKESEKEKIIKQEENIEPEHSNGGNEDKNHTNIAEQKDNDNVDEISEKDYDEKPSYELVNNNRNENNNLFSMFNSSLNRAQNLEIEKPSPKEFINTKTLLGHTQKVVVLIQLNSGKLASGGYDNLICIWDIFDNNKTEPDIKLEESERILALLEFEENKLLSGTGTK